MVDDKFATIVEETEVHEFDPHGDVVLILHRRTFSEASDEGASDGHQDNADADGPIEETTPVAESPAEEEAPADEAPPPEEVALALEGSAAGSDDVVAQAALLEYYSSTKLKEKKNLSPRSKEPKFMEHVQHVRLRVSSKHLILTSQMFKAELLGGFKEAEILRNEQFLEKSLPDDDADAWIILLNILHHRNRKVPRTVDLETLTQVACLVDKYFLHEAVEVFANLWISDLLPEIPNVFWRDAVTWICISGVFKEQETYKKMTKLAQLESKGKIDTRELPFPSDAIEEIDKSRWLSKSQIISLLLESRQKFLTDENICQYGCDAKILGILTKEFRKLGLVEGRVCDPFEGLSLQETARKIRDTVLERLLSATDCQNRDHGPILHGYSSHGWPGDSCQNLKVRSNIERRLNEILNARTGLDLPAAT